MFELKIMRRDGAGRPMPGRYVEYATDSAEKLADWFEKQTARPSTKHRKANNDTRLSRGVEE